MDRLQVAVGGVIDRHDECPQCGNSMLYRLIKAKTIPFCGNPECSGFLREVE